jgi:hypothetical protein
MDAQAFVTGLALRQQLTPAAAASLACCRARRAHPRRRRLRHAPSVRAELRPAASEPAVVAEEQHGSLEARLDPVAARVRAELAAEGINLDELLNAGKVVNLSRKLDGLRAEFAAMVEIGVPVEDGGRVALVEKMDKLRGQIVVEKRQVMQAWLKRLFLVQAGVFAVAGGVLSMNAVPGVDVPLVGQALGFWSVWLFTIPALRARKGTSKAEKSALNVSFLGTPLLNVALPFATKNCGVIWAADVMFLIGAYLWYIGHAVEADGGGEDAAPEKEQNRIKGMLKYLDWGSFK